MRTVIADVRVFDGLRLLDPAAVVDGDPLADIRATRAIRRTWFAGR